MAVKQISIVTHFGGARLLTSRRRICLAHRGVAEGDREKMKLALRLRGETTMAGMFRHTLLSFNQLNIR
jgi:hypothetical protein